MRSWKPYALAAAFAFAVLALAARLAWVAAHTETGWQTLALTWREAASGWLGGRYTPVIERDADAQADFWLAEADRVLEEHGESAELAMGAACILDRASMSEERVLNCLYEGLAPRRLIWTDRPIAKETPGRDGDSRAACSQRCLELAALATRLEPENPDWWRMRALLVSRGWGNRFPPREPNWRATIDDCARHDPDNSLYDYLAARALWLSSSTLVPQQGRLRLQVRDSDQFALADRYYQRGMKKRVCTGSGAGTDAATRFAALSGMAEAEKADLIALLHLHAPRDMAAFFDGLLSWHSLLAAIREDEKDLTGQLAVLRQALRCLDQIEAGDPIASDYPSFQFAWDLKLQTAAICQQRPDLVSAQEASQLQSEALAHKVRWRLIFDAMRHVFQARMTLPPQRIGCALTAVWSQTLAVALLAIGLATWITGRAVSGRRRPPPVAFGLWRHALVWTCSAGASFTLLGILPTRGELGEDSALLAFVVLPIGIVFMAVVFQGLLCIVRTWAEHPDRVPALRLVLAVTLWQLTVVATLSLSADGIPVGFRWVRDQCVQLSPSGMVVMGLMLAAMTASLGWLVWRRRKWTGRLPWPPLVTLAGLLLLTAIDLGTALVCPEYLEGIFRDCERPFELPRLILVPPQSGPSPSEAVRFLLCFAGVVWRGLRGLETTAAVALVATGLWFGSRARRQSDESFLRFWTAQPRARWGAVLQCVGRSALAAAAAWVLIYLAVAPHQVRAVESACQEIERDASYMQLLRAQVAAEIQSKQSQASGK